MNTSWMLQGVSDPEASNDEAPESNELGHLLQDEDHLDFHIPVHHSTAALLEQAALMSPGGPHHQSLGNSHHPYATTGILQSQQHGSPLMHPQHHHPHHSMHPHQHLNGSPSNGGVGVCGPAPQRPMLASDGRLGHSHPHHLAAAMGASNHQHHPSHLMSSSHHLHHHQHPSLMHHQRQIPSPIQQQSHNLPPSPQSLASKMEGIPETPFYCSRCRYTKDVTSFMDGNRKRKTCSSCRSYGRKYLKKKEGQVDLPGEEHLSEESKHTSRSMEVEDDEMLRMNNMAFIDNMNWLCHHLNEFKDNQQHVKSLRKEFGRIIAHSRLSIESYMTSSLSTEEGRHM